MAELNILIVCVANVCRSPLAERVLLTRLQEFLGEGASAIGVRSAGVLALVGNPMEDLAAEQLRRLGGSGEGFASTQWTSSMSEDADLVLTATRELRSRVLEETPRALRRTFTIREFAALATSEVVRERRMTSAADLVGRAATWRGSVVLDDYDVPDPVGQPKHFHQEVADLLDRDCTAIARALVGALLSSVSPHP